MDFHIIPLQEKTLVDMIQCHNDVLKLILAEVVEIIKIQAVSAPVQLGFRDK